MSARVERGLGREIPALALLLAAFVAAVLPLVFSLNVWQDETYSLRTTSGNFAQAWRSAIVFEAQPPLYLLVLEAWRMLDRSVTFARLFSVLCACGTIACMWAFARRQFRHVPALAVAFAFAVTPFAIYTAVDIRGYALAVLLSALVLYTFFAGFFDARPHQGARAAHVVLAVAAVYTQYFAGALLVGCFLALAATRRLRAARAYAVAGCIMLVGCLPIAKILPAQLSTQMWTLHSWQGGHFPFNSVIVTVLTFALPHEWIAHWSRGPLNIAYWVAFVTLAALFAAARPRATPVLVALGCITATVFVFFIIVTTALHQELVTPRHFSELLVPVLASIFALVDALGRRRGLVLGAYLLTFTFFSILSFVVTYGAGAKFGDFKRAGAFLEANARPGQTIFVFDQEMTTPLSYYYHGPDPVVALPEPQRFDRFDARRFVFHSDAEVRAKLNSVPPRATAWLYEADLCSEPGDAFGCRFLEDVIRQDFDVVLERPLYQASVRELVRRAPARQGAR